jgi:hypothetical protein
MRIQFTEGYSIRTADSGRSVTLSGDVMTIAYSLKDYYINNDEKLDDQIMREVATLESLKNNLRGVFPK